jgi:DNA-binding beta-propeller fold protein YncE
VTVVDVASNKALEKRINVSKNPFAIAMAGDKKHVYVASRQDGSISKINLATHEVAFLNFSPVN